MVRLKNRLGRLPVRAIDYEKKSCGILDPVVVEEFDAKAIDHQVVAERSITREFRDDRFVGLEFCGKTKNKGRGLVDRELRCLKRNRGTTPNEEAEPDREDYR